MLKSSTQLSKNSKIVKEINVSLIICLHLNPSDIPFALARRSKNDEKLEYTERRKFFLAFCRIKFKRDQKLLSLFRKKLILFAIYQST